MGLKQRHSPRFEQLRSLAQGFTWHRCDHYFPLIEGPEDLETLIKLRAEAEVSKEARKGLEKFIRDKVARAETHLRKALRLGPGRPRDHRKEGVWEWAAMLRQRDPKKWSWSKLASKYDPNYDPKNPKLAADRIRHGVQTVLNKRAKTR